MRATVYHGPFDVRVEQVRDAALQEPTDAVVRITHAAICGSDVWLYRGLEPFPPGGRLGHEWMGMVEEVGSMVSTIKRGDRVIAPFAFLLTHDSLIPNRSAICRCGSSSIT